MPKISKSMTTSKKTQARRTKRKYQSVSLPWDVYNFLKQEAVRTDRSVNFVVNNILAKRVGSSTKSA
jgi:hypothetical protein